MIVLKLYTTAGCHLCEQAQSQLQQLSQRYSLDIHRIEIGDNDRLVEQYGLRIPVIQFPDQTEIDWPFHLQDLRARLEQWGRQIL